MSARPIVRHLERAGKVEAYTFDDDATLLEFVEEELGATSASRGCTDGRCGTCRVLLDGRAVNACLVRWRDVPDGARLETYEDVANDEDVARAVAAFEHERPTRCRLCVGSLGVTAASLAREGRARDPDAIEAALETATCMCTGRGSLRRALRA